MGFEPTRAEPIGLAVQRLNHSATSSHMTGDTTVYGQTKTILNTRRRPVAILTVMVDLMPRGKNGEKMRRPGIEPGSTAWKAAMLTIIPPTLGTRRRVIS